MTPHSARAFLDVAPATAKDALRDTALSMGAPVGEAEGGFVVQLRSGTLRLSEGAGRAMLELTAAEPAGLQTLRDLVAARVGGLGLRLDWQGRAGGARPANVSLARVEQVARISPSYVRVVIAGPDLGRFARGGLHFRVLFGPEGAGWPVTDADGLTRWPGGAEAWHRPVYTTREIEPLGDGAARIVFDVFRHEGGRVTDWTGRVRIGDAIALSGPGGGEQPTARWLGLVGDETAVPVIARMLAAAPVETEGVAVLFVPESADIQELRHPPGVAVRWATRGGDETPLDALRALAHPEGAFVFFAAERAEASLAREWLRERGLPRGSFQAASYWTAQA